MNTYSLVSFFHVSTNTLMSNTSNTTLHHGGMDDPLIHELAVEQGRIILTNNVKDFRPLLREDSPGVIGIPVTWSSSRLDTALTAIFMRHGSNYFRGRFRPLAMPDIEREAA